MDIVTPKLWVQQLKIVYTVEIHTWIIQETIVTEYIEAGIIMTTIVECLLIEQVLVHLVLAMVNETWEMNELEGLLHHHGKVYQLMNEVNEYLGP